jgi:hypothetical protein
MNLRSSTLLHLLLLISAALLALGCNEYYIPPPPIQITLSPQPSLGDNAIPLTIVSRNSSGDLVSGRIQFTASIYNVSDTSAIWYVNDIQGGNSIVGTISSTGLYTAPGLLPNPTTVVITAAAHTDPTHVATVPVQLQNPVARVISVSLLAPTTVSNGCPSSATPLPAAVAGQSYILSIQGSFLYPGITQVTLGHGPLLPVDTAHSSSTQLCVGTSSAPILVSAPGMVQVEVVNPSQASSGNPGGILSQPASPAASASIATLVGIVPTPAAGSPPGDCVSIGNSCYGIKAYVPRASAGSVAVVDPNAAVTVGGITTYGKQLTSISMPSGFSPIAAAANPLQNTVAVIGTNSSSSVNLVIIDAISDTVSAIYSILVSGTATFSDGPCQLCAIIVDANLNQAILSTSSGFLTVDLSSGATSTLAIPASQVSENFGYDYLHQTIYAPFYATAAATGGLNVVTLASGAPNCTAAAPCAFSATDNSVSLGNRVDAAAIDPLTVAAVVAAEDPRRQFTAINFNASIFTGSTISAPATAFCITPVSNCAAANAQAPLWDAVTIDLASHTGFFANEGAAIGIGTLSGSPGSGPPVAPAIVRWGTIGSGPDGSPWTNAAAPHSFITYVGLDGKSYALALRNDQSYLARIDLVALRSAAHKVGSNDPNEVDPTASITYTLLQ